MRLLTLTVPPGVDIPVEPGDQVEVLLDDGGPQPAEVVDVTLTGLAATITVAIPD